MKRRTPSHLPQLGDSVFLLDFLAVRCSGKLHKSCVSHWAPFVSHILRVFPVRNQNDCVSELTEIEGQKRSSAWCQGLNWA